MIGWQIDQVLASAAFEYLYRSDSELDRLIREVSVLQAKENELNPRQKRHYQELRRILKKRWIGDALTAVEREFRSDLGEKFVDSIRSLETKLFGDDDD